jgi:hypothetical protein
MRPFTFLLVVVASACGPNSTLQPPDAGATCGASGANLLTNPGFECGESPFIGVFGGFTIVPNEGRNGGKAGQLTVGAAGARFALEHPITKTNTPATYCFSGHFKGTAPFMRLSLEPEGSSTKGMQFAAPIDATWARVPPSISLKVSDIQNTEKLFLLVEIQTGRADGLNGRSGQVLYADDFELRQSSSDRCD